MFDASNGERVARELYDEIVLNYGGAVGADEWESCIASALDTLGWEDRMSKDAMTDLMAWALEDTAPYEIEDILTGNVSVADHLAAALEAEHECGWGRE